MHMLYFRCKGILLKRWREWGKGIQYMYGQLILGSDRVKYLSYYIISISNWLTLYINIIKYFIYIIIYFTTSYLLFDLFSPLAISLFVYYNTNRCNHSIINCRMNWFRSNKHVVNRDDTHNERVRQVLCQPRGSLHSPLVYHNTLNDRMTYLNEGIYTVLRGREGGGSCSISCDRLAGL